MRAFLGLVLVLASGVYACSSNSASPGDASGAGGTTGTAGTMGPASLACGTAACCDKPESQSGCAPTKAAQLAASTCATGAVAQQQEPCGAYTRVHFGCGYFARECFYDAQEQLQAWRLCEDTIGPCGDNCTYGGRHADGGFTEFFQRDGGALCPSAP